MRSRTISSQPHAGRKARIGALALQSIAVAAAALQGLLAPKRSCV
jgi:hypothetical protein